MPNPIKTTDLFQDDGGLDAIISKLQAVNAEYEKMSKSVLDQADKLGKSLNKVNVTTSEGREEVVKAAKQTDELTRRQKKLNESIGENAVLIAELKEAQRQQNQINKLTAKLNKETVGSYNALAAEYALNKIKLKEYSAEQLKNDKQAKQLLKDTKALRDEMEKFQEQTGDNTLKVGRYTDALKELPGAAGAAGRGIGGLSGQLKALIKNPIVAFIALAAGGLITLFNAFKQSEKGAVLFAKISGALKGLFSALVGVVDKLADATIRAFNDPQQAIKDLWATLKENIVNRFEGLINLFRAVGSGLKALWQRDLPGLKKAAQEAGTAVIQLTTGLDAKQQKDFADSVSETTKAVIKQTEAFANLAVQRRRVARLNRSLVKSIEQLTTKEELLRATAGDTTKSFKEREAAAEATRKALEDRSQKEIQLARNNLSLINQEIALRRKNGEDIETLFDQQLAAYQALATAERQLTLAVRDNERTRAELKQDRLERDLDILIDGFDNQKTVNERLLKDDKLTFDKRHKILEDTRRLADVSFNKQIETIQKFTGTQISANELIRESDAVALNEKIRGLGLSEIIEGRLLEIVRERRLATQDLAEVESDLAEAKKKSDEKAVKAAAKLLKKQRDSQLRAFNQEQVLAKSEFNLLQKTEAEKTKFRIQSEILRRQKILELNEKFDNELSEDQIQTIKNQIKRLQSELDKVKPSPKDLFDLLGLKLDDQDKQAIQSAFEFAKQQLFDFLRVRQEIANQRVNESNTEVAEAQRALQSEIQNRNAGFAHRAETATRELDLAKSNQKKALAEQKKAQQAQQRIEAIQQAGSLVTATAKIWQQLGFPFALPAIGIMWGSFIASKVRAAQLSKKEFTGGGYEILGGGTHASGEDTFLGVTGDNKAAYAEKNEGVAVFKSSSARKYASIIPSIVDSINNQTLEDKFMRISGAGKAIPLVFNNTTSVDMSTTNGHLKAIRRHHEKPRAQFSADGRVRRYRNITTYYS